MKIKVDENIGRSGIDLLRRHGHDATTVHEQGLSGVADEVVFQACVEESRTLVTLDRDFGQLPRFPPQGTTGIVILELGGAASISALLERLRAFLALAARQPVADRLWIVEPGRVRIHLGRDEDR